MGWIGSMLRRARMRNLAEGLVQTVRAEATDDDAKETVERWQDYGLAANPGDGQGLVVNIDGHTIVLRLDRIAERPRLAPLEVAVWHKEGHFIKLKAGKIVEVSCDELLINATKRVSITAPTIETQGESFSVDASGGTTITTPKLTASDAVSVGSTLSAAKSVESPTVAAGSSLTVQGKEQLTHSHGGVQRGNSKTDPQS